MSQTHLKIVESLPHIAICGEDDGFQSLRHICDLNDTSDQLMARIDTRFAHGLGFQKVPGK